MSGSWIDHSTYCCNAVLAVKCYRLCQSSCFYLKQWLAVLAFIIDVTIDSVVKFMYSGGIGGCSCDRRTEEFLGLSASSLLLRLSLTGVLLLTTQDL